MSVKCLNSFDQACIVDGFTNKKFSQVDLATKFGVSRRTVQRVLINHGVLVYKTRPAIGPRKAHHKPAKHIASAQQQAFTLDPSSPNRMREDAEIIRTVRQRGLNATTLKDLLANPKPTLNRANVELFLCKMPDSDLATLAYTVGLVRVKQVHNQTAELMKRKEAANG